jgi:hypothetical protein
MLYILHEGAVPKGEKEKKKRRRKISLSSMPL